MRKILLSVLILLAGLHCDAEMMLVEVIEKRILTSGNRWSLEVHLKSINSGKYHLMYVAKHKNEFLMKSEYAPDIEVKFDYDGVTTADFEVPDVFTGMKSILPLGLELSQFFDYETKNALKLFRWGKLRDFLFKGLDENEFELKSTSTRDISDKPNGIRIITNNYWFHRKKGEGIPLERFTSATKIKSLKASKELQKRRTERFNLILENTTKKEDEAKPKKK